MSLQDVLLSHIFPPRGEQRAPTAQAAATSATTTDVDATLVAACIRAADADPTIDQDPFITFEYSSSPLDSLSHISDTQLVPDATIPITLSDHLRGVDSVIRFDGSVDEPGQYPLLLSVYGAATRILIQTPEIFRGGVIPLFKAWDSARASELAGGAHGRGDLEVMELNERGVTRRAHIMWEHKRELVLLLIILLAFVDQAMGPGGVRLALRPDRTPILLDQDLHPHVLKWCCQVSLNPGFDQRFL